MSVRLYLTLRGLSLFLVTTGLVGLGCAGGSPAIPTQGSADTQAGLPDAGVLPFIASGPDSYQAPLGLWQLDLDFASGRGSLTPYPSRGAVAFDQGDSVDIDITALLTNPNKICGDCLRVSGLGLNAEGHPTFDITLRHPLTNAPQLAGFDLQGMLVNDSAAQAQVIVTAFGRTLRTPVELLDADGASAMLTPAIEAALGINLAVDTFPYRNFAVDRTAGNFLATNPAGFGTAGIPAGHNVFGNNDETTVTYELDLDPAVLPQISYLFAMSASFFRSHNGQSGTILGQKGNPIYFLPEANRKEPWEVIVTTVGNGLNANDLTSKAVLDVSIRDWQNGLTPQATGWNPAEPDPSIQPRDAIPAASDVTTVELSIPGLTLGVIDVTTFPSTGDGRGENTPLVYAGVEVFNTLGATAGTYLGLVRVQDSRVPETGAGEGDLLYRDSITFAEIPVFETYAIVSLDVADDLVFAGSDFSNQGHLLRRIGDQTEAEVGHFAGLTPTISGAYIHEGRLYLAASGPFPSGDGTLQVFDLATGANLLTIPLPAGNGAFDVVRIDDDEVYVTGFGTNAVYRVNVDPAFGGTRVVATIPLGSVADPGFLVRPTQIIRTTGSRFFLTGNHLDPAFTPAPAGLLIEIDDSNNTIALDIDTTGVSNTGSLVEVPFTSRLTIVGAGTTASGDGGSGTFNVLNDTWAADTPPGTPRDWFEVSVTSNARGFIADSGLSTVDHLLLPSTGAIRHLLNVLPPGAASFPFISGIGVDGDDYLYVTEFGAGTTQIFDASAATDSIPPRWVQTLTLPAGLGVVGVFD